MQDRQKVVLPIYVLQQLQLAINNLMNARLCTWSQCKLSCDIADSINTRGRRILILVYIDETKFFNIDVSFIQSQVFNIWTSADCPNQRIHRQYALHDIRIAVQIQYS